MAKRDFQKKPLYRKVNTRARGVFHNTGPDYRYVRNTKAEQKSEAIEATRGKMRQGVQREVAQVAMVALVENQGHTPASVVVPQPA